MTFNEIRFQSPKKSPIGKTNSKIFCLPLQPILVDFNFGCLKKFLDALFN